jgi:hypothetical protein
MTRKERDVQMKSYRDGGGLQARAGACAPKSVAPVWLPRFPGPGHCVYGRSRGCLLMLISADNPAFVVLLLLPGGDDLDNDSSARLLLALSRRDLPRELPALLDCLGNSSGATQWGAEAHPFDRSCLSDDDWKQLDAQMRAAA